MEHPLSSAQLIDLDSPVIVVGSIDQRSINAFLLDILDWIRIADGVTSNSTNGQDGADRLDRNARSEGCDFECVRVSHPDTVCGKAADDSQPTPRRARMQAHAPTPETGHRMSKRVTKVMTTTATASASASLPTPTTVSRKRKTLAADYEHHADPSHPSPTGHTTFAYSSSSTVAPSTDVTPRRRAGHMFNQRMETGSRAGGSRHGAGVGMGGSRTTGHKVDQIIPGKALAAAAPIAGPHDENPFVVPGSAAALSSPGRLTRHRAGESVEQVSSRYNRPKSFRSPPALIADPIHSATSLLSPPPTQRVQRIHFTPPPPSPRTLASQAKERAKVERMQKMRDEKDNPFYVKPGQSVSHRPGPVVDESRATVTYVFRGAKKLFANPFAGSDLPFPEAELNVEDDEFEPHPCPKPKLLWPTATPGKSAPVSTPKRSGRRHRHESEDEVSPPSSPMPASTPMVHDRDRARFESDDEFLPEGDEDEVVMQEAPSARRLLFAAGPAKRSAEEENSNRRTRRRM